ncbi:MAG TPA: LysR family transcriptional regulator [Acidisoma sp.]|uniref:LysR family transcriptional regulator n=1 Tax=Acidisoma sp. TaxID=1872115 RepID=UPI002B9258C1|nr:LysR family transcriptional regulator [Acidisoma sp.]HTI02437.1 LysR family transcriptional regulator [Acidisoma sp.]
MDLRALRAFTEVIRQGGFSQAAEALHTTQSNVSKTVRQLEEEVGLPLLDRVGHRSHLTVAGEVVHARALKMLADRADLVRELEEMRGLRRGRLRLGLAPIGASTLFAPHFATYRARYPGIEISLVEQGSSRLQEMLREGEIDLGALLMPVPDAFDWQDARRSPVVAVVPQADHLPRDRPVPLAALADHPFILFEAGFALNAMVLDACAKAGISPRIVARSSQPDFIFALVAAGLGIGFLPRLIVEERAPPGVRVVTVTEPDMLWHMVLAWRRDGYLSDAARAWLALLRGEAT